MEKSIVACDCQIVTSTKFEKLNCINNVGFEMETIMKNTNND